LHRLLRVYGLCEQASFSIKQKNENDCRANKIILAQKKSDFEPRLRLSAIIYFIAPVYALVRSAAIPSAANVCVTRDFRSHRRQVIDQLPR
jgi:hypothetical protein